MGRKGIGKRAVFFRQYLKFIVLEAITLFDLHLGLDFDLGSELGSETFDP
jgi:hypothetical protein